VGLRDGLDAVEKRKDSRFCRESNAAVQSAAQRYTDWAIVTLVYEDSEVGHYVMFRMPLSYVFTLKIVNKIVIVETAWPTLKHAWDRQMELG
jgi:hypothetical protein